MMKLRSSGRCLTRMDVFAQTQSWLCIMHSSPFLMGGFVCHIFAAYGSGALLLLYYSI